MSYEKNESEHPLEISNRQIEILKRDQGLSLRLGVNS